jgi:two-component system sensor histidine kinase PilS (NtrC family)
VSPNEDAGSKEARTYVGEADLVDKEHRSRSRRIAYFMLFRLVMLALFTVAAAVITARTERGFGTLYTWLVWGGLAVGFSHTIVFSWLLPRTRDFDGFAWGQTAVDIVISAVVVQMSGGVGSGFQFLYLIAVLGAAIMGDRRQCWAAAGACALIYSVMSMLESVGVVTPLTATGEHPPLAPEDFWNSVVQTLAAMAGVAVLAGYLNAQLASRESEIGVLRALNQNILRSLTSGILTADTSGKVVYFNPAARKILGLKRADLGRTAADVLPGLDDVTASTSDPAARVELEVDGSGGNRIHVEVSSSPVTDADGERLGEVISFQDVTALHALARRVRRNERLAAIGSLAASVAHEVRNPLAAISGSAELLSHSELEEEDGRLLSVIQRESTRLGTLVTDLLAFTRPTVPQRVRLDLVQATAEASEAFRTDPASAEIEVHFTAEGGVEADVDPSLLTQVLWNLMRNARDAMDGSGMLKISVTRTPEFALIAVGDTGPGIPADNIDRIFDPFFTTKEQGTGFGLALAHRIVEEHGGSIKVTSALEEGAVFTVSLPLASPAGDESQAG